MEDTGWNHPPWPKRVCSVDLRKMTGGASPSEPGTGERIKESSFMWPMLTRSNYTEWSMLMQCNYETLEIWDVVEPRGEGMKRSRDR